MGSPLHTAGCLRPEALHMLFQCLECPSHPHLPGKLLVVLYLSVHLSPPPAPVLTDGTFPCLVGTVSLLVCFPRQPGEDILDVCVLPLRLAGTR